jgi:hypothetical protein
MIEEFCRYCGAGVGEFRREGEGTCPRCDCIHQWVLVTASTCQKAPYQMCTRCGTKRTND